MTNTKKKSKANNAAEMQSESTASSVDEVDGRLLQQMASLRDGEADAVITEWMQQLRQREQLETKTNANDRTEEGEDDEADEEALESCSSFSLQECIDEFHARRIRRISTHSRDVMEECFDKPTDVNLIQQNRINKEQERKCKPCKNGFCYCFTSDSGDAATACKSAETARAAHMRHIKRNKKLENLQSNSALRGDHRQTQKLQPNKRRISAPAALSKSTQPNAQEVSIRRQGQITAISRLEASKDRDAPLIHIVQELHNNCVISEVRVNRQKMGSHSQRSGSVTNSPQKLPHKKTQFKLDATAATTAVEMLSKKLHNLEKYAPSAPVLQQFREGERHSEKFKKLSCLEQSAREKLSSLQQDRKAAAAQQKLVQSQNNLLHKQPPPKPPRLAASVDSQSSINSLDSTTSSLQQAEQFLDDFLKSRGFAVPGEQEKLERSFHAKQAKVKHEKRKTFPIAPLPTCPSLSEIEQKERNHYDKNIKMATEKYESREHYFGWQQPKISEMLNYDNNANTKQFRSQGTQAEPQAAQLGWQAPQTQPSQSHKIALDTVDGFERQNLASNVQMKSTPVKTPVLQGASEQLNTSKPLSKMGTLKIKDKEKCPATRSFLRNSKRKILRLVSPKKENKERINRDIRKTPMPLRHVAVQTSVEEIRPYALSSHQSPPGSYQSAEQTTQPSSTTTSTQTFNEQQEQFNFERTVKTPSKKSNANNKNNSHRKLNFCGADVSLSEKDIAMPSTYRSYQTDLEQETTLSKMGYILSNIRAKLEASDEHAVKTFQLFHSAASKTPLSLDLSKENISESHMLQNHSNSCPNSPSKSDKDDTNSFQQTKRHASSLNEICRKNKCNVGSSNISRNEDHTFAATLNRLRRFKDALQSSLRKSKNFVKTESKRLSHSLPFSNATANAKSTKDDSFIIDGSNFSLGKFFAMNEQSTLSEQLATAVSICRQLPDLEISANMVEAERLLLFSNLQKEAQMQSKWCLVQMRQLNWQQHQHSRLFFIDEMLLPTKANPSQDIFFNYFYIVTFECDGLVKSTQSVECYNQSVAFFDCGIEFACDNEEATVNCEVFMLRLRKVSTLSLEPKKSIVKLSSKFNANCSSSSSCNEEIVSRFRRQAQFKLRLTDFQPLEYVPCETQRGNKVCLRAAKKCQLALEICSKSSNIVGNITVAARTEARFPKQTHKGFLNVQDPHSLHNWNRRWCTVSGLQLFVWPETNDMTDQPLYTLDLRHSLPKAPLSAAPRELCARPRSFCLQCPVNKGAAVDKADDVTEAAAVFFAAESQQEFDTWLLQLNEILSFIATWL